MKKILMSLALAAVSAMAFAAQPSADDAKALVEQQAKTVFTKLNANQSRYRNDPGAFSDLIKSEVLPYMDFELMSQVVLGRHWRDASAQQRQMHNRKPTSPPPSATSWCASIRAAGRTTPVRPSKKR